MSEEIECSEFIRRQQIIFNTKLPPVKNSKLFEQLQECIQFIFDSLSPLFYQTWFKTILYDYIYGEINWKSVRFYHCLNQNDGQLPLFLLDRQTIPIVDTFCNTMFGQENMQIDICFETLLNHLFYIKEEIEWKGMIVLNYVEHLSSIRQKFHMIYAQCHHIYAVKNFSILSFLLANQYEFDIEKIYRLFATFIH